MNNKETVFIAGGIFVDEGTISPCCSLLCYSETINFFLINNLVLTYITIRF